jgi:hypothetical protein
MNHSGRNRNQRSTSATAYTQPASQRSESGSESALRRARRCSGHKVLISLSEVSIELKCTMKDDADAFCKSDIALGKEHSSER